MSKTIEIPDWLLRESPPSPPPPPVDDHRVEGLVNGFIAGKQVALFDAPDAYYRTEGADAVDGAPAITQRLQDLRNAALDQARDDGERAALAPRLDAHLDDAMDGIRRHVAAQQTVRQRGIIATRQALIQRAAQLEHDNDDKIAGLAEAHASAARELARLSGVEPGSDDEADILNAARSQILRAAIEQRIANAKGAQAIDLHDRMTDALTPADRHALQLPIAATRDDTATDAWLARQDATDGPPLIDRVESDDTLPDTQRLILRAKIGARESADESNRVATVKGLDDQLAAATKAIAIQPSQYRIGTLNALAQAYADAGEPDKANDTRRLASQESLLRLFAQTGVATQQRQLDQMSGPERTMAEAIMNQQADAFAKDPYAAGTALYPDVGPALPEEDAEGRLRQIRVIDARRGAAASDPNHNEPSTTQPDGGLTPVNLSPAESDAPTRSASDADGVTGDSRGVQIAEPTPDDFRPIGAPARGVAPPTEPPSNDPELEKAFEAWPGVKVTLPNGNGIPDATSPTGYVMAPFNDLKSVAEAGKRERLNAAISPVETLRHYLAQGGVFDYQRRAYKYGKDGFTQLRQFRNISNINAGLFAQKLKLPLWVTLKIAGEYASKNSSNAKADQPFSLDPQTMDFIVTGYHLGDDGVIE